MVRGTVEGQLAFELPSKDGLTRAALVEAMEAYEQAPEALYDTLTRLLETEDAPNEDALTPSPKKG